MTVALVGAFATIAALIAAAVWIVSVVRADGRERATALQLAERVQGETNLANLRAAGRIQALARDLRATTRRADALEEWARNRVGGGVVDDGTDLLLAELSIIAAGAFDDDEAGTVAAGGGADAGGTMFVDPASLGPATAGDGDAGPDEKVPEGATP